MMGPREAERKNELSFIVVYRRCKTVRVVRRRSNTSFRRRHFRHNKHTRTRPDSAQPGSAHICAFYVAHVIEMLTFCSRHVRNLTFQRKLRMVVLSTGALRWHTHAGTHASSSCSVDLVWLYYVHRHSYRFVVIILCEAMLAMCTVCLFTP